MNKIKEWKTKAFKPRMWVIYTIVFLLIAGDLSFAVITDKKHSKYISFPEDLPALKAGDTLYLHNEGDTTIVDFQPSPGSKPVIVLPN